MVFGNLSTGYWLGGAGTPPHWQELGRTTLGVAGDNIDVTSLANKPYLMILTYAGATGGNVEIRHRLNGDTGSNYSRRRQYNGTEATSVNSQYPDVTEQYDEDGFAVSHLTNLSAEEKLVISHSVHTNDLGAGVAPNRQETVWKWANTANAVDEVNAVNPQAGSYESGSEVVVLGYDPADTSGTNFWEELASVELGIAGDTLDSGTFTAKKYLYVQWFLKDSGAHNGLMRFNSDSGSNYARRFSTNGGADSTGTSSTSINFATYGASVPSFSEAFIINKSDKEKLAIGSVVSQNTAGAGNAPSRREGVGKWANTSSQITSIQIVNTDSGDFAAGSIIKVWGAD